MSGWLENGLGRRILTHPSSLPTPPSSSILACILPDADNSWTSELTLATVWRRTPPDFSKYASPSCSTSGARDEDSEEVWCWVTVISGWDRSLSNDPDECKGPESGHVDHMQPWREKEKETRVSFRSHVDSVCACAGLAPVRANSRVLSPRWPPAGNLRGLIKSPPGSGLESEEFNFLLLRKSCCGSAAERQHAEALAQTSVSAMLNGAKPPAPT